MNIYGERLIAVQTYWQRGMLLNRKKKCCMIHAPPFCGNVYIGTPWVLFHPEVVAVNKDLVVFCLVSAIPLFDLVLFGLCSQFSLCGLCVDVFPCTVVLL